MLTLCLENRFKLYVWKRHICPALFAFPDLETTNILFINIPHTYNTTFSQDTACVSELIKHTTDEKKKKSYVSIIKLSESTLSLRNHTSPHNVKYINNLCCDILHSTFFIPLTLENWIKSQLHYFLTFLSLYNK